MLSYPAQPPIDAQSIQRIEPISQLSGATRPCFLGCGPVSPSPHIRRRSAGTFRMDSLCRSALIGRSKAQPRPKFRGLRLFCRGRWRLCFGSIYCNALECREQFACRHGRLLDRACGEKPQFLDVKDKLFRDVALPGRDSGYVVHRSVAGIKPNDGRVRCHGQANV